jgi:hypothetical protein
MAATYSLTASASSVGEGGSVTITLNTTEVADNELVRWIIAGSNISTADFVNIPLEGNFNVINNTSTLTIPIREDLTTEGTEYLILSLPDVALGAVAISILIDDTSRTPLPEILPKFYVNSNTPVSDEGEYIYFNIRAIDLEDRTTVIPWILQGIPSEDILGGQRTGTVTLLQVDDNEWQGTIQIGILENFETNGDRTAFLTINPPYPYVLEVSQSVIIRDSSLDTDPFYQLSVDKTRVIEGGNVTVTVTAFNIPDGTIVPVVINAYDIPEYNVDITAADFIDVDDLQSGLFFPPLVNNTASLTFFTRDDFKFEQTEYFYFGIPDTFATSQVIELIDSGNLFISSDRTYTGNINVKILDKAILTPDIGGISIGKSDWEDLSGKLSESVYVQGRLPLAAQDAGIFYQPFSYVIRSSISIELWKDSIKKVLHPAGLALFSEVDTETLPGEEFNVEPKEAGGATITDFFALTADNERLPFCASNVVYTNSRFSIPLKSDFAYYIHKEL